MSLKALAAKTNSLLIGDEEVVISGVGSLSNAKLGEITFLASSKYRQHLMCTQASAVIVTASDAHDCPKPALVTEDPKMVFTQIVALLYPQAQLNAMVHESAVIDEGCEISPLSHIGPYCVIGKRVKIGPNVIIHSGCSIGDDCEILEGSVLYPNVTVYHACQIGKHTTIHSGVVIGSDGFGFVKNNSEWMKVPQIGRVKIGDRVEIGANTTIDRGAIDDTEIGNDVILDNLIQIAHNVKIGEGTAISACVGIAGSTTIGKHCLIGGGSKINGHISLCDFVNIVGCSNVAQSITKAGAYASGISVNDIKVWKRNLVRFHQLDELALRLRDVEKKLKAQEEAQGCP